MSKFQCISEEATCQVWRSQNVELDGSLDACNGELGVTGLQIEAGGVYHESNGCALNGSGGMRRCSLTLQSSSFLVHGLHRSRSTITSEHRHPRQRTLPSVTRSPSLQVQSKAERRNLFWCKQEDVSASHLQGILKLAADGSHAEGGERGAAEGEVLALQAQAAGVRGQHPAPAPRHLLRLCHRPHLPASVTVC